MRLKTDPQAPASCPPADQPLRPDHLLTGYGMKKLTSFCKEHAVPLRNAGWQGREGLSGSGSLP